MEASGPVARQSGRFMLLYALAWAGGSISYVPFLTILLPARVADLAGDEAVRWLAYIAFAGAISASLANILFGWLSDVTRNRRGWIMAGLALSCALLLTATLTETLGQMLAMIVAWQCAINMMLAPLAAWAGDCIPDRQKGTLGGSLAFAPAIGALSGALVTVPGLASGDERIWLVALFVAACVLPVMLFGNPRPFPELMQERDSRFDTAASQSAPHHAVGRMWIARLLLQVAESALFAYLLLWFRSISPSIADNDTARIFSIMLVLAIPLAMLTGRWADRRDRPIMPLVICAAIAAGGLAVMAMAPGLVIAIVGYVLFGLAATVFLSLHAAQTLRVLPNPKTRARDLGFFNLTNTIPSMIMPGLTLLLVPVFGFEGLFALLCVLAASSGLILLSITRGQR
ncbi:MFS transporter [Altererythrobacter sp.]|uniref:MFS transporter n=1 Tax=Altererythrobacter sp. TaxID=1872480 RepID=UPI003D07E635